MGDPLAPVSKGEPIFPRLTADWWNTVGRAVNTLRGGDVDLAQKQLPTTGDSRVTVAVVNKSGSDIDRPGGCLSLDGLAFSYADRPNQVFSAPVMRGDTPTGDDFVILTRPLKNNQPGTAILHGLAFCRLNYTDDTHDKATAGTVNALASSTDGVPILWREKEGDAPTTGEQWALVILGSGGDENPLPLVAVVTGTIPAGSSSGVSWLPTPSYPASVCDGVYEWDGYNWTRVTIYDPITSTDLTPIGNPFPYDINAGLYPVTEARHLFGADNASYMIDGLDISNFAGFGADKVLSTNSSSVPVWTDKQDAGEVPSWVFVYDTDPIEGGSSGTDELVKCSSNDTTAKYIEGVFPDSSTNAYTADKDLLVTFETQNDGNNETQKAFISRKDLANYAAANTAHLGFTALVSDAVVWLPVTGLAASKHYVLVVGTDGSAVPTITALETPTTDSKRYALGVDNTGATDGVPTWIEIGACNLPT